MKKIILLMTAVIILSMFSGCRRQNNENSGEPTVNNTTETSTVPSTTSRATRPSTEPTIHTTAPDSTMDTNIDGDVFEEETTSGDERIRGRMLPRR